MSGVLSQAEGTVDADSREKATRSQRRRLEEAAARPGTPGVTPRAGEAGSMFPTGFRWGRRPTPEPVTPGLQGLWGQFHSRRRVCSALSGAQQASPPSQVVVTPRVPAALLLLTSVAAVQLLLYLTL